MIRVWVLYWVPFALVSAGARANAYTGQCSSEADLADIPPGSWCEVPGSHMRDVAGPLLGGNVSCVMNCWAGGAFDTVRERLYVTGGGHAGYAGNEIYAFDVKSLKWLRLNDPAPLVSGTECPDRDVAPCATHTYDGIEYMPPPVDRLVVAGCGFSRLYRFDPATLTWEVKNKPMVSNDTGNLSAYDPMTGLLFYRTTYTGSLYSYDGQSDTWRTVGGDGWMNYYYTASIDPKRRKMVVAGQHYDRPYGDASVLTLDLDISGSSLAVLPTTGAVEILLHATPGLEYDSVVDRIVAWANGGDVYSLDLDSATWERHPAQSATVPGPPNMNGTWGRFRYIPSRNLYVLANDVDQNVFLYRLGPGQGTGPIDAAVAVPADAAVPTDAAVQADAAVPADAAAQADGAVPADAANPADATVSAGSATFSGCQCQAAQSGRTSAGWALALLWAFVMVSRSCKKRLAHIDELGLRRGSHE